MSAVEWFRYRGLALNSSQQQMLYTVFLCVGGHGKSVLLSDTQDTINNDTLMVHTSRFAFSFILTCYRF